jgi:hypothetical protein
MAMDARIPMIAITISNSIKVKPFWPLLDNMTRSPPELQMLHGIVSGRYSYLYPPDASRYFFGM